MDKCGQRSAVQLSRVDPWFKFLACISKFFGRRCRTSFLAHGGVKNPTGGGINSRAGRKKGHPIRGGQLNQRIEPIELVMCKTSSNPVPLVVWLELLAVPAPPVPGLSAGMALLAAEQLIPFPALG